MSVCLAIWFSAVLGGCVFLSVVTDDRYKLVIGAIVLAVFPPVFCLLLTHDVRLTRAQNAIENTDLAGRDTGEIADPAERGSMRLHGASPARRLTMSAGAEQFVPLGKAVGDRTRRASGWRARGMEEEEEGEEDGLLSVGGVARAGL